MTSNEPVLSVRDLTVRFPTDDGLVQAVRGVSYDLHGGEVLGIVGESGSGKSVTSMAVMGLLPKTARISGSVTYGGKDLLKLSDKEMNKIRGRSISMVFQDPMTSLNPVYTVGDQIAEAITAHHDVRKDVAHKQAVDLLDLVRIPNPKQRADEYPHQLSGGMRQRVVIAIAIANNPQVIIADEPTTALDVTVQAQILEALQTAQKETGAAMVLITHDLGVIAGQADRVQVMYAGKSVETGTVDEIFYTPRMPYTLGLLGSLPRLDIKTERLVPIAGSPPSMINMPPGCPFSPRCPLAQAVCDEEEPSLSAGANAGHLAACHFSDQVAGHEPGELFRATSKDTTDPLPAKESQ
ncbi:ABC transporter ATP-binding protein [Amycolatopsis pigmentata]|uniref:ABC transporter ATP-binding protein n=1 Tax=Amycolatopsis pigmentata TaxID=450801 RepID=A0ABW5FZ72_9PSEU